MANLFFLKAMLNMKHNIAKTIPIPAKQAIVMYRDKGIDTSWYVTYVESRGMFPSEK